MTTIPDILGRATQSMPACTTALVGLSGGLDSIVLLHGLTVLQQQGKLPFVLRAIHINHGLHPDADQWQQHCAKICDQWGVAFVARKVDLSSATQTTAGKPPAGLEKAARDARYAAFRQALQAGEALLLAHHRDDQMETLLLRLLRGAGPRGLAGIPVTRELGAGFLWRPLLEIDRTQLLGYAQQHQLAWINDASNADQQFDRNYLRHAILPLLEARWPGYRESWSKSAALQREAESLLVELAESDLQSVRLEQPNELAMVGLTALSKPRQRNLLRRWLVDLDLPEPGWNTLQQLTEVIIPAQDSNATYPIDNVVFARFRERLVVLRQVDEIDTNAVLNWDPNAQAALSLPANGLLQARPATATTGDTKMAIALQGPVQIRYRQGGETCTLRGRPHKSLKKILQEQGIETWHRARLPLLYADGELIYIPGVGATEASVVPDGNAGLVITWQPPDWMPGAEK